METLLPSEIARLVLGYLEDQKCNEAARIFLETSPHLQECRTVISNGRRFSTKVNGMTLMDIVEKLSAINSIIQERLAKVSDCEQLKHCGDLLEQLKFLVEETRGQRFVVNINVPSQTNSQISNGSPIISSSMRKRRHSNSDRERFKRTKLLSNTSPQSESLSSQAIGCEVIEATPLDSLPGHTDSPKSSDQTVNVKRKNQDNAIEEHQSLCNSKSSSVADSNCTTDTNDKISHSDVGDNRNDKDVEVNVGTNDRRREDEVTNLPSFEKCTAATSTEELLSFSCAEVQTTPYYTPESETETNDEPIENLSLLTKELLNRTELQERIAENINKAILPVDTSLRDESLHDSIGGEQNTSIMVELTNAIKSIVEATETDPVFEKFLDEIIGPHTETDTSPDEETDMKQQSKAIDESQERQSEDVSNNVGSPEVTILDARSSTETDAPDLPLKRRLRSSSRQQTARIEDEMDKQREHEKEQSALEDQNAAAVLSIINANIINNKSANDNKKIIDTTREIICFDDESEKKLPTFIPNVSKNEQILKPITNDDEKNDNETATTNTYTDLKVRKSMMRRPRPSKPKREPEVVNKEYISEPEIITMPTLVMCSKEEISDILTINTPYTANHSIASTINSRFIPIAPKESGKINRETVETLYLKAVNVPQTVIPLTVAKTSKSLPTQITVQSIPAKGKKVSAMKPAQIITPLQTVSNLTVNVVESDSKKMVGDESITLYGSENCAKTLLEGTSIPTINVEENISLSGTGLSPYLKFSCNKNHQNQSLSDIDVIPIGEDKKIPTQPKANTVNEQSSSIYKTTDCDVISKRTPRSLLKSRSKNHRLSLSTPRRRSNHIRALDFNTPTKIITTRRTSAENETTSFSSRSEKQLKSVCKSSLFKSPPFSNTVISMRKVKSPSLKVCQPCKTPVEAKSLAPNSVEGYTKHNADDCTDDASLLKPVQVSASNNKNQSKPVKVTKDTWDADLRKALQINQQNEHPANKTTKAGRKKYTRNKDKCNSQVVKSKGKKILSKNIIDTKDESSQEQVSSTMAEEEKCKSEASDVEKATSKQLNQIERKDRGNVKKEAINVQDTSDVSYKCNTSETQKNDNNGTVTKNIAHANNNSSMPETKSVKKYAQLKTIKTNLGKCNIDKKVDVASNVSTTDMLQSSEVPKSSVDIAQHILQIPHIIDLETPRKFDIISGVPPTPRLLSPSSNSTPLIKISEDSSRMRSFINTPEFPTTPCITITPKSNEDTTRDSAKKDNFNSCSPYYKPTSEQHETSNKTSKLKGGNNIQISPIISSNMQQSGSHGIVSSTNMYQTSVPTKFEITQFEVIKENLPKEEAVKELKISSNSGDSTTATKLETNCIDKAVTEQQVKNNEVEETQKYCTITNSEKFPLNNEDTSDSDSSTSSDSSSSSSSSSTSSSSSSDSTVSSKTSNSSTEYLVNKKRSSVKIYTDSSNDSEPKDTLVQGTSNDITNSQAKFSPTSKAKAAVVTISHDTDKVVCPSIKSESSPLKVFSIIKSEEELKSSTKETPAKDDTLLNEADISETPSSSKAGVESLTNLSSKISAFINSDEQKLAEPSSSLEVEKTAEMKMLKEKPKVINVERLRSRVMTSRRTANPKYSCSVQNEPKYPSTTKKLAAQMEAKRQRMIAKFREIPKTNISRGRTQSKNVLKTRGNLKKNTTPCQHPPKDDDSTSTRKRRVPCNNSKKKEIKDETKSNNNLKIDNFGGEDCRGSVANVKPVDSKATTLEEISSSTKYVNAKTGIRKSTETVIKTADLEIKTGQRETAEMDKQERRTSNASFEKKKKTGTKPSKEDPRTKSTAPCIEEEKSSGASKRTVKETIVDKTSLENVSVAIKVDQSCQEEVPTRAGESASPNGKTQFTFKSKVDQVKRDLFIDEKNACKVEDKEKASRDQSTDKMNDQTCSSNAVNPDDANPNDPKDLSSVLQCLQLVPASKTDTCIEEEQATDMDRNEFDTSALNSVEYHFIYDDDTPVKKRRRRYSSHELEFQINIILNDQYSEECVKVMTTTDYEEIFNITPKSKKKLIGKKSPTKNEISAEAHSKTNSILLLKNINAKPLATSSPVDKTIVPKTRKTVVKNVTENEETNELQSDNKKKLKSDKSQETEKDNPTTKVRKRKISESKDVKQMEKKSHISNPQALLSNLDLDRFLTSVHGPA